MANAGAQTLGILVSIAWWIIKLIPNIVMAIVRGVRSLINSSNNKPDQKQNHKQDAV